MFFNLVAQRSRVPLPDQSQAMMAQNSERRANDLHRKSANRGFFLKRIFRHFKNIIFRFIRKK